MKGALKAAMALVLGATVALASAAELPVPSKSDSRLRFIDYNPDQVFTINVMKGIGTRIVLGPDEKIVDAAPGFGGDCKQETSLWCIVATVGENNIFVKPKGSATEANNLEVKTDKRSYSFDFVLNPAFSRDKDAMFRVTFRFPAEEAKAKAAVEAKLASEVKLVEINKPKNWAYSMEVSVGSDVIAPSKVYDDGRFTRLVFPNNRQMPEVFAVEADGSESLVPSHVEKDTIVVHRVYKKVILRLSKYVVGVWNDAYDSDGIAPEDGTTIKGLRRVIRGQE